MEGPHVVDASGTLTTSAGTRRFVGMVDLAALLARDPQVQECVARRWLRFGLGRIETEADRSSLEAALDKLKRADLDLRVYLKAVAQSRTFRFRSPEAGEVL
jgi:hypothetical protein